MIVDNNWKKILIVDDDISVLNMLEILLRKENFREIYKANGGIEAVKLIEKMKFDIVLLDINMPDMNGYEVCRRIRNISMVPIIFLSGKEDESDKLISFAMGGDDYITKPFSVKELIARINAVLKRMEFYESGKNYKGIYKFEDYSMNFEKQELYRKEKIVDLTLKEYMFLSAMEKH